MENMTTLLVITGSLLVLILALVVLVFWKRFKMQNAAPAEDHLITPSSGPRIVVIGIGGAGNNTVSRLIDEKIERIEYVVCDTDVEALSRSSAVNKIQLGNGVTHGLGTKGNIEVGRQATVESRAAISDSLSGKDVAVIFSGMGGGTGTSASIVIANIARELGILTVAIVTKPFRFEKQRIEIAEEGTERLYESTDVLAVIQNERLLGVVPKNTTMLEACRYTDEVARQFIAGLVMLCTGNGDSKLEYADIHAMLSDAGEMVIGTGEGVGKRRTVEAAKIATSNPLLERTLKGATRILVSIIGPPNMKDDEVNAAIRTITSACGAAEVKTLLTIHRSETQYDRVAISVIGTGFVKRSSNVGAALR